VDTTPNLVQESGHECVCCCCCLSVQTAAKIILSLSLFSNICGFILFGFLEFGIYHPVSGISCSETDTILRIIWAVLSGFFVPVDILAWSGIIQRKPGDLFPWIFCHMIEIVITSIVATVMLFSPRSLIDRLICTSSYYDRTWEVFCTLFGIILSWYFWDIVKCAYYELKLQDFRHLTPSVQSNQNHVTSSAQSNQNPQQTLEQPPPYEVLVQQPPPYQQQPPPYEGPPSYQAQV